MRQRFLLLLDGTTGEIIEAGNAAELASAVLAAWHDLSALCTGRSPRQCLSLYVETQNDEGRHRARYLDSLNIHSDETRARAYIAGRAQRWLDAEIPGGKWVRTLLYEAPEVTIAVGGPLERREPTTRTLPDFRRLDVR